MGQLEQERQDVDSKNAGIDGGEAGAGAFGTYELAKTQDSRHRVREILDIGRSPARASGTQQEPLRGGDESSVLIFKQRGVGAGESLKSSGGWSLKERSGGGKSGIRVPKAGGAREGPSSRLGGRGGATNTNPGAQDAAAKNVGASPGVQRGADALKCTAEAPVSIKDETSEVLMDDAKEGAQGERSTAREADGGGIDFYIGRWFSHDVQWPDPGPTLAAARTVLFQIAENFLAFLKFSLPLIKRWSWLASRAILVLVFYSLECGIRGLNSVFRLGSAALFLLVWCAALNLAILAGFGKFGIALGLSLTVGVFLGYTPSFGLVGLFGAVVLWAYGSFWTTGAIILLGGVLFIFDHARKAILITMLYSLYSVKGHGDWIGLIICTILAFISSDVVVYLLSNNTAVGSQGTGYRDNPSTQAYEKGNCNVGGSHYHCAKSTETAGSSRPSASFGQGASARFANAPFAETVPFMEDTRSSKGASTSATSEGGDPASVEEEVARVLSCTDHYAILGFSRYDNFDVGILKREYRKLAMLVHPDKNGGNPKAEEAFKRLQNAYEVLLDSIKRKVYDDDLRREEVLANFRQHRQGVHQVGRCQSTNCGCQQSDNEAEDTIPADSRQIACKRCSDIHVWMSTDRSKLRARWCQGVCAKQILVGLCQDCQDYHQAKDGDGWIEQSGESFFFGMFQKVDVPQAFACAEGKVYNVSEWAICQGMKCPPNTHKPTFHVSTASGAGKNTTRGANRASRGGGRTNPAESFPLPDFDENMTEHEFFDWLEAAMASGMFGDLSGVPDYHGARGATKGGKAGRKRRKGKKQW